MLATLAVATRQRTELIDVTAAVRKLLADTAVAEGIVTLFVPHTTAAVTINENADPDVQRDLIRRLDALIFPEAADLHREGNSDAHLKSSLVGPSLSLIVAGGELLLGTWQGIYFCEFDGPRRRTLHVKILAG